MTQKVHQDHTADWKFPLEQDGWFKAHDALRADMTSLHTVLANFKTQVTAGKAITPAQMAAAGRFFHCFIHFLHHHHSNEEDIVIPYMSTRCKLPDKIAADHAHLVVLMDRLEREMNELLGAASLAQQAPLLEAAMGTFGELQPTMVEHLKEEEEEALPLMREHFKPKEIATNVVSKIVRSLSPDDVGTMFHRMTVPQRKAFARQESIPFFIAWILFYQTRKYERNVWAPFERECLAVTASA